MFVNVTCTYTVVILSVSCKFCRNNIINLPEVKCWYASHEIHSS